MPLDDDIALFEGVPMLAALGRDALRILAIGSESHRVQNGAVLFYAGDLADGGYLIQHGSFLLEPESSRAGDDIKVGPGALLGELSLLTDTVHSFTATALTSSSIIRIPRNLFLKMLEGYPAAAEQLRDAMAQRVNGFTREIVSLRDTIEKAPKS